MLNIVIFILLPGSCFNVRTWISELHVFLLFCSFNFGIIFGTGAHNSFLSVYCISTHLDNSDILKSSLVFHVNHCNLRELSVCVYISMCVIAGLKVFSTIH